MELEALKYVGVGLLAIAMMGAAIGVGNVFNGVTQGISRNPSAGKQIQAAGIIGAGLAEALGILAFVVMLLILFV